MPRPLARYVCQECGAASAKWSGRCDDCGAWNTIVEEAPAPPAGPGARARGRRSGQLVELSGLGSHGAPVARLRTGNREFDRVVGGGLVAGSALLVGGDPGIGKSTLLLQIAAAIAAPGHRVIYMSGEEAADQVRLRAARLGVAGAPVELGTATSVADIVATLERGATPRLVVIDSIQTMWDQRIDSAPGTVAQVRASAQTLIRFAKERGSIVVLVGHVTKDGQIAGPRVVEHMVDAVLYFEGDRGHRFRILRGVKNRFGPTDEIGVFDMTGKGLEEVENPSALFIGARDRGAPGAAVFAGIEGTRPLLVEIQALVAPSPLGTPRRAVVGTDSARLAMILAVLEARCGISLAGRDVYLNVAGGLRIQEPAADLAVAAALVSSLHGEPLDDGAVWFGEVSLSGALRPVAQSAGRLREAAKLGFTRAVLAPTDDLGEAAAGGIRLDPIEDLARLVLQLSGSGE
jgi:DNA repair protein RadA/Sms